MKNYCLFLLLFLLFSFNGRAQGCNLSTVYFRSGKHNLTKESKQRIDSLLSGFSLKDSYLMELHGLADTTQSAEYNLGLVQRRIKSVRDYISLRKFRIYFIEKNSGEGVIATKGNESSRRVDIWFTKLNYDFSVSIKGELGESVRIPIRNFKECGYCTSDIKIQSEWQTQESGNGEMEKFLSTTIETPCDSITDRSNCISEWRIPSSLYNSPDKLKIPLPLKLKNACLTGDSISPRSVFYTKIEFDSLNLEYVVTAPCYYFAHRCFFCGGQPTIPCPKFEFIFPENLEFINNYLLKTINNRLDTVNLFPDSLYSYCREALVSYGYLNGKFVYLKKPYLFRGPFPDSKVVQHFDSVFGFTDYYIATIDQSDYTLLQFSDINVKVKVKKNISIDSVGFLIPEFGAYIPADQLKKRIFTHKRPEKNIYKYAIYSNGDLYLLNTSEMKSKYNKRKRIQKVKVGKKNLIKISDQKNFIVLPND